MANRVGRKIYRTSANHRKKKTRKALKALLLIVILAALVFVGYSIGQPIYEYISNKSGIESAEETKPWTPPVLTEENEETDVTEGKDEETTQPPEEEKKPTMTAGSFSAYQLPLSALESSDTLTAALNTVKENGYTAVIVNLKAAGGKIYYKTASDMALSDETAVVGKMYAGQIAAMIKQAGFIPIAQVNLLEDNNRYGEYKKGSYRFAADESTWLDNAVAKGGKPWLSPFDTDTQSFVEYISSEVSGSGYEYVIFDGLIFPNFRNSDLNYIGDMVKSADRYKALTNIANIASKTAELYESKPIVMLSVNEIITGTSEIFKPSELAVKIFAVEYFPSELEKTAVINGEETALSDLTAYNKAQVVFGEIKRLAGEDAVIVPVMRQTDFSQADFNETITALMDLDCNSYIILS